jgi:type I restriction enzyme S subunit
MQTMAKIENGFKETEIGLIPDDWEFATLSRFADILYGKVKPKNEGNVPVVGSGGIYGWTDKSLMKKPTIIIGRKGTAGSVQLMLKPCWPSDTTFYLNVHRENVIIKFLYYFMTARQLSGEHARTTLPSLQKVDLENYTFPLPLKDEQQKIVLVLSKIQQAIEQQDKIIETIKNLKKSLMQKLFTEGIGHTEFKDSEIGQIPENWEIENLGQLVDVRKETVIPNKENETVYIGLEHIDSSNVRINRVGSPEQVKSSKFKFHINDILYGKLRPYLDKVALAEFEGICSTDIIVIKTNSKALPTFIVNRMHLKDFLNYATSTMTGVNHPRTSWSALSKFMLGLPPIHEQEEMAYSLNFIDKKIDVEERKKSTLQQLFKTMLHKLMTGEIRVKNLDLGVHDVN